MTNIHIENLYYFYSFNSIYKNNYQKVSEKSKKK